MSGKDSERPGHERPDQQGLDEAVEKILADPSYAREVLQNPELALTSSYRLLPGEWRSIHWSLVEDVINAIDLGNVDFRHLSQLPKLRGGIDRASQDPTAHARLTAEA
jgi:hypothetical protein